MVTINPLETQTLCTSPSTRKRYVLGRSVDQGYVWLQGWKSGPEGTAEKCPSAVGALLPAPRA